MVNKIKFQFNIVQAGDGSGKGAALIACIAEKLARVTATENAEAAKKAAAAANNKAYSGGGMASPMSSYVPPVSSPPTSPSSTS